MEIAFAPKDIGLLDRAFPLFLSFFRQQTRLSASYPGPRDA